MKLGVVVVTTFALCWLPFLQDVPLATQVLNRLFPFARGLFEVFITTSTVDQHSHVSPKRSQQTPYCSVFRVKYGLFLQVLQLIYLLHLLVLFFIWNHVFNHVIEPGEARWFIYASVNEAIIVSDNGVSRIQRQAIIWTSDGFLLAGPLGTNFSGRFN